LGDKLIKDSVHGYINVEASFVKIINTVAFQRLKRLQQTSYRVLYPSASHDRFIHSVGVYHLGRQVFKAIYENTNIDENGKNDINGLIRKWREPFLVACLLHDIGHAPFSHTCEEFYEPGLFAKLEETLKSQYPKSEIFEDFVDNYKRNGTAKPHEIMSAMMIVKCGSSLCIDDIVKTEDILDFVIRAILGCPYTSQRSEGKDERQIKNALIRIVNSELIDVDKLDYIVRDSVISGFRNVDMDLPRLINSFVFARKKDIIWPMYKHSAQSVIENVFTARGNATRWIMSHNAVVYESALLQTAITKAIAAIGIRPDEIFNYNSLTSVGSEIISGTNKRVFRYLGDDDIICLLKEYIDDSHGISEIMEYFDRNLRKRAIWKTHSEYVAMLGDIIDPDELARSFSAFISPEIAPPRLNCINFDTFDDFLKKLPQESVGDFKRFFEKLQFDFTKSSNDEAVFIEYKTSKLTKPINRDEIFLLYDENYTSLDKAMGACDDSNCMPKTDRGFFVFYKPRIKAIKPRSFIEEYRDRFIKKIDGRIPK